jgi:hypothetical protein
MTPFFIFVRWPVTLSLSKGRAQRPCPPCFDMLSMTPVFFFVRRPVTLSLSKGRA